MIYFQLALLCITATAQPAQEAELLPKTPPDWRFERIDFPLDFAPELKYQGFEELRFAPGMFDANSDTYFTYIFAMKIASKLSIGQNQIKSLLETYFKGLCKTVTKESKFTIDVSKIKATVTEDHYESQHARHFTITLQSFDPFVTGKPLKLNIGRISWKPSVKCDTDSSIAASHT